MEKLSKEQRHKNAAIKRGQSDACINSVEREQARRHANMAAIRSKDTKPEMIVRRGLWKRGFRYRLNHKRLPGHPDLVLRKYRTCIFVNGCFWHGHNVSLTPAPSSKGEGSDYIVNSECCKIPKTNREFWVAKIRRNKERDKEEQRTLASMGWHCITVWECELKPAKRKETLDSIAFTLNHIWLQDHGTKTLPYPKMEEEDLQMPMAAECEV
jgi:DNA mismatch endonuclease (patch repair protein)